MLATPQRDTRRLLLDAAGEEFAEHGIAGARVDRIAARSGVNKQRIYAHFGNKEDLFAAVMARAYRDLAERVPAPTAREGVYAYVCQVFDFHRRDSSLVRLLAWEGLHYGERPIPDEGDRRVYYEKKGAAFAEALGFDGPPAVAGLLIGLIGIASWPFIASQQRRLVLGADVEGDEQWVRIRAELAAYGEAVVDSALASAGPEGSAGAGGADVVRDD